MAKNTGQKLDKVKADMERDWMSADEAVSHGVADEVLWRLISGIWRTVAAKRSIRHSFATCCAMFPQKSLTIPRHFCYTEKVLLIYEKL